MKDEDLRHEGTVTRTGRSRCKGEEMGKQLAAHCSPQVLTECLSGAKGCSQRCSGGQADQVLACRELTVQEGNTWKGELGVRKDKHDSRGGPWTPAAWGGCPQ